ncbi:hypothetical protein ACF0H5_023151 [Mactra antiquata]
MPGKRSSRAPSGSDETQSDGGAVIPRNDTECTPVEEDHEETVKRKKQKNKSRGTKRPRKGPVVQKKKDKEYPCTECNKSFTTEQGLKMHTDDLHPDNEQQQQQ